MKNPAEQESHFGTTLLSLNQWRNQPSKSLIPEGSGSLGVNLEESHLGERYRKDCNDSWSYIKTESETTPFGDGGCVFEGMKETVIWIISFVM